MLENWRKKSKYYKTIKIRQMWKVKGQQSQEHDQHCQMKHQSVSEFGGNEVW